MLQGYWKHSLGAGSYLLAMSFVLTMGAAAQADGPGPQESGRAGWVAIPSGIADPDRQTVYMTGVTETLTALDLATGNPRWETNKAQLPLAIDGDLVIARTSQAELPPNTMQIVVLDAATGEMRRRCRPIVFPAGVAVGGGLGLSFRCTADVRDHKLTLTWQASRTFVASDGKATPAMIAAAKKDTTGLAHVDLESGHTAVTVDASPQFNRPREMPFYDVADKRLTVNQRVEQVDGGVQLVNRTLEARDRKTGRPLWQQPIVGEVYLPVGPPPKASKKATPRTPRRR